MPVGSREQQFVGNLIVLNNITKYKELDSAKTNFISTVSHEMKTPISSILMSLQLLGDNRLGQLNEEQKQLVGSIRESSDRLLNITGELLNMTQVESGKLRLMPKVVKPVELIDYAVKATQVLAERFRCFVEVEYPEKISKLFVDNEKIAWVITNLLSNAIHHSPENSRIIVGAVQHEKAVEIFVQDFGRSCLRLPAFLFIRTEMSGLAAAGGCRKEIKFAFSPAFSVFIYFAYFRRLNTVEKRLFKVKIIIFAGVQHQIIISNYGRFFFGTSRGRQQNRSAQTAVDRALHHGWGFQHHGSEP